MSVPTPDSGGQHRPARITPNLGIPVPGDDDYADYVSDWGSTADAVDGQFTAALAAANAGFAAAINAAHTAGSQPARTISFLTMGG